MYVFKGTFGRYQSLLKATGVLSNNGPWAQQLSSSSVCADSADKEEPDFGWLSSDPSSELYERKKTREKSSHRNSERQIPGKEVVSRSASKLNEYRNIPKDDLPFRSDPSEFEGQSLSVPLSKTHKTFQEKQTLGKWSKFKNADRAAIEKLAQGLVQDDDEKEYLLYFSRNPAVRLKLFNERYKDKNLTQVEKKLEKGSQPSDSQPKAQTPIGEEPFGSLSPQKDLYEEESGDEGDEVQRRYEEAMQERRHRPAYYGYQMKKLCKERKLLDALRILEVEMPAVFAKPDHYCYQVLINACGRAGYTRKAFHLYNEMKKRRLEVQPVAYTGLFNACAQSPWPTTDGLSRALKLRKQLKEKGYVFNQTISHAMIKAFGRCGDIKTAFEIVDEMLEQGLLVDVETINFMLQACISDQETGFRHAIMIWRKMRELRLRPDIYSYNLLVRCVGSCKAGDPELTTQLLEGNLTDILQRKKALEKHQRKMKALEEQQYSKGLLMEMNSDVSKPNDEKGQLDHDSERTPEKSMHKDVTIQLFEKDTKLAKKASDTDSSVPELPNLLGFEIKVGSAIGLSSLDQPQDRLALIGGPVGLVGQMIRDRVKPDLKTMTQMLHSLPPDTEVEESLLQSMKNIGLSPDTQFCNMLIRKRCFRRDAESAKDVLDLMREHSLLPDLITFGCLALGCRTLHSASEFLKDMDDYGFRPNLEIMTALVKNSIVRENYYYTHEMLREMRNREIVPDDKLISHLERARNKARETILKMESRKMGQTKEEKRQFDYIRLFLLEYRNWLKKSEIPPSDHPWAQYEHSLSKVN